MRDGVAYRSAMRVLAGVVVAACAMVQCNQATAGPALVFNARSGEVLHAHEPFARWYPASLTKLMTAYVTFRAIREGRVRLDAPVRISQLALDQPPSKMGFPVGTQLSIDYAVRILMVKSANDIAVAVGEAVSGTLDSFIGEMNAAAARLGMTDTHFVNPHGLPDKRQVTTARDLGLLARALILEFPEHQHYFSTQSIQVGQKVLVNHNKLIGRFQGADGLKTGFICSSGFNLAASATRRGHRLVAIVLGAPNATYRSEIAAGLLETGFAATSGFNLFGRRGTTITQLRRPAATPEPVDLRPYICQNQKMPDHLASFGTVATRNDASPNASARFMEAGSALALASAPILSLAPEAQQSPPVMAFSVPLPRPRPATRPVDETAVPAALHSGDFRLPPPNPARALR